MGEETSLIGEAVRTILFLSSKKFKILGDREDSGGEAPLPDSSHADLEPRRKKRSQHHQVNNGVNQGKDYYFLFAEIPFES